MIKKKIIMKAFYPSATFILIFLVHAVYSIWKPLGNPEECVQSENISPLVLYFNRQDFFLGFSYALAGSFTVYAFLRFLQNRRCGVVGILGGFTLTGGLYIVGCFLLGCCGSPMPFIYMSILGTSFLKFTKPIIAVITTISVIIGYFWIEKKNKSCCM